MNGESKRRSFVRTIRKTAEDDAEDDDEEDWDGTLNRYGRLTYNGE